MNAEYHEDGQLKIEVVDEEQEVRLVWRGRSVAREPGTFILPILTQAVERAERAKKRVVMDFRSLEYLNSSTLTPIIRILEQAKRGSVSMTVVYNAELKWQALSFSALYLFQSLDGRVVVEAR